MSSNIYNEEPKNSIELRRIYDMVSKISCDLANNYEQPEKDVWSKHFWGAWPIDKKDKTIRRLLKLSSAHNALQPWHRVMKNEKLDFNITKSEELSEHSGPFGYKNETVYLLEDKTEILYTEQGGIGGSYRSWNIISTGKDFSQMSYKVSLPVCYGNGYSSLNLESLGRLVSIKEPRLILPTKQYGSIWYHQSVSYELEFEKRNELNQITIHLHPDSTFDSLFLITFFGIDPNTIEATNNNFPKYIFTAAENVTLMRLYPKEMEV